MRSPALVRARTYDHFDGGELMPYRYGFVETFSTLLRNADISTLVSHFANWHKYTYSAIDIVAYRRAFDEPKRAMSLDSLSSGLRLIADFDHLDKGGDRNCDSRGKRQENKKLTYLLS